MNAMVWIWLGATVLFGVMEAATAGLVSIWFVCGSVVAAIAAGLNASIWIQLVLFIAVTAAALALTRPLIKKMMADKAVPTNADRVLGTQAKVTETIDNENSTGAVYVDGKTWSARSEDGSVIPAGEQVTVETMEGVKLFVKLCERAEAVK